MSLRCASLVNFSTDFRPRCLACSMDGLSLIHDRATLMLGSGLAATSWVCATASLSPSVGIEYACITAYVEATLIALFGELPAESIASLKVLAVCLLLASAETNANLASPST